MQSGFARSVTLGIERRRRMVSLFKSVQRKRQMDLEDAANAPKRSVIGGETIEEHSLKDRIEYERYKRQQDAAEANQNGLIKRVRYTHPRP